ncbi:MAG: CusA/CzcA family heavy metal efflux RND transporter [Polyangiaceae bacterium]
MSEQGEQPPPAAGTHHAGHGLIERLLVFSVHKRGLVIMLALVFVMLGAFAAPKVPIDAVPDVTNVQVQIITPAPDLGPLDVETYVTAPVERAMAGVPGLEEIRSISRAGISVVTVVFTDATDLYDARTHVDQRLEAARKEIPGEYGTPTLGPLASGLGEVYHFEVKGDSVPLMDRRRALDWQIAPRLRLVPGVVEVNTFGGEVRSLEVALDPQKLASQKLGVEEVVSAIQKNHIANGGAYLVDGPEHVTVRGEGRVRSLSDLGQVSVRVNGAPVYLRDLGEIREAPLVRYGAVTRDGREGEAVVGVVMMLRGAPSGATVAAVKDAIADIQKSLPPGMTIDGYYDRTDLVSRTKHTVGMNLLEASILVALTLFLTLANLRAGLLVALSIPIALLGVFLGMWLGGVPGNLVSLGAIDFGLVVDGAIIVVENAQRRLAERRTLMGRILTPTERDEEVLLAAKEVRGTTAFGEAIVALVYVPLLALGGVEGRMFKPMALTVLFALGCAFVLSLTLVPALASWFMSRDAVDKETWLMRVAHRGYARALQVTLKRPWQTASLAVIVFAASIGVFFTMGKEFLPKLDEGTAVAAMVRLPSVSLVQATAQSRQVEKTLLGFPEVTSVVCRTGRAEVAVDPMGINMSDVYIMLKPKSEWKTAHDRDALMDAFDKALADGVPGASFAYTQPIEMNTSDLLAGISSDLAIHIYGHDLAELSNVGEKIMKIAREVPGSRDVRVEQVAGMNVLTATVDRTAVARAGVDTRDVLQAISAVGGIDVGDTMSGPIRVPIRVRWSESARSSPETLAQVPVRTAQGTVLPLAQLANIVVAPGPSQVSRERLARRLTVQINVRGRDVGTFVEETQKKLNAQLKLPTGVSIAWAGEYERFKSATERLELVIPVTVLLILVLLVATFGRVRPALLVLVNLPLAVSGGIVALAVRGMPFSISAGVGMIALFGVAVLNGLVLVAQLEKGAESDAPLLHTVHEGAMRRLRPVLTTALVASLGFIPMAISHGAGAEVQQPLATVVIGGVLSSTMLTLFVLPSVYLWLGRKKKTALPKEGEVVAPAPAE